MLCPSTIYGERNMICLRRKHDILSVSNMPQAYIIAGRAISYRRYITCSSRNGYHCKNLFCPADKRGFCMVGVTGFEPAGKAALRAIFLVARFKKSAAPITRGHGFIAAYIIKKACTSYEVQALVGVTGFEPVASWSRTKRDTKLRHTPKA